MALLGMRPRARRALTGYLLIAPAMLVTTAFLLIPMVAVGLLEPDRLQRHHGADVRRPAQLRRPASTIRASCAR